MQKLAPPIYERSRHKLNLEGRALRVHIATRRRGSCPVTTPEDECGGSTPSSLYGADAI